MHGYGEYSGYDSMSALIQHTVHKGSIAIYPRWQTAIATPCPGPFNIEPCIASAVNGISGALDYLRSSQKRVQPQLRKTSYFGFSFGGIVTANMTNRYQSLGLPKPQAVFVDDPHDGGFAQTGLDEPALDDSLAGIPPGTKFECHSGADGVISEPGKANSSCNALFPKLTSIPAKNKDLLLTHTDDHGQPTLSSGHGVCAADAQSLASARRTPTTGTSAGKCGTRSAAARSRATTARTRSATRESIARWATGATALRSRR